MTPDETVPPVLEPDHGQLAHQRLVVPRRSTPLSPSSGITTAKSMHVEPDLSAHLRRVCVNLRGHSLWIDPMPQCISQLATSRLQYTSSDGGSGIEGTMQSLLDPSIQRVNAGLIDILGHILSQEGLAIEVAVWEPSIRKVGPPQLEKLPHNDRVDSAWIELLHHRTHGLVQYGRACDIGWFLEQALLAYPDATMAVATSRTRDRDRVAESLRRQGAHVAVAGGSLTPAECGRVVVGTLTALAEPAIECWRRHFLFFPEALDAISVRGQDLILQADTRFRVFGFLATDTRLAQRERDLLACVFGLDATVVPRHGHTGRPVRVAWRRFRHGGRSDSDRSLAAQKRQAIWRNRERNRLIVQLALGFLGQRRQRDDASDAEATTINHPLRVTILVDNVDHAVELGRLLPAWPIRAALTVDSSGMRRDLARLLDEALHRPASDSLYVIATVDGLAGDRLASTDVLIWAGAGLAPPPFPPGSLETTTDAMHPLLVVDIDDRPHKWLRRSTEARRAAYIDRGWFAPGVDRKTALVERFLARRRGRNSR